MAIPNMFTVRMHAQRILRHKFDQIVDAVEPGGGGDPFEGLSAEEHDALTEVTRMGFPLRSWFGHRTMGMHAFPVLYGGVSAADPAYFEDFWAEPGYLGFEMPPSLQRDRIQQDFTIVGLISRVEGSGAGAVLKGGGHPGRARGGVDAAWRGDGHATTPPVAIRLSGSPDVDVMGADLDVLSGTSAGARIGLLAVEGDVAVFGPGNTEAIAQLRAGDAVRIDNSGYLAAQTYHRHQVPEPGQYAVWDQFRHSDGSPRYPQRPLLLGPLFAAAAAGTVQTGRFEGKMIVVESLLDREAFPWQAHWYRDRVREHLGETLDGHFRLWFTDNALHGDDEAQEDAAHTVSYLGMLHQALRDLSRWVEEGVAPPPSTRYDVVDGQVTVPSNASDRGGIQPVVSLSVNDDVRAEVAREGILSFRFEAEVPNGTGAIVAVEWDPAGSGTFSVQDAVAAATRVVLERPVRLLGLRNVLPDCSCRRHSATSTGRARSRRLQNLARVRVVVRDV